MQPLDWLELACPLFRPAADLIIIGHKKRDIFRLEYRDAGLISERAKRRSWDCVFPATEFIFVLSAFFSIAEIIVNVTAHAPYI